MSLEDIWYATQWVMTAFFLYGAKIVMYAGPFLFLVWFVRQCTRKARKLIDSKA